jgi:hypothetical protein
MINLQYSNYNSSPEDVLSLLLSVPLTFSPPDLYNAVGQKKHPKVSYILKGMVCFNGGHYVTYIHNILSKLDYVLDPINSNACFQQVNRELRPDTEWTLLDDRHVIQKAGGWKEILTECIISDF